MDKNTAKNQNTQITIDEEGLSKMRRLFAFLLCISILAPVVLSSNAMTLSSKLFALFALAGVYGALLPLPFRKIFRYLPAVSSTVCVALRTADILTGESKEKFVKLIFLLVAYLGFILCSAVLGFCSSKKASKTDCFVASTFCFAAISLVGAVCAFINAFGSFSVSLFKQKVAEFSSWLHTNVMQTYEQLVTTEEFATLIKSISGSSNITADEFLKLADDYTSLIITGIKAITPALIIVTAMMFANAAVLGYTAIFGVARGKNIFGKGHFEYSVSGFTARVFNTVIFIAMLGTFIGLPGLVLTVCTNLLIILLFPLSYIGLRQIYRNIRAKNVNPLLSVILLCAVSGILFVFSGGFAILAFAFAGVFFTMSEEIKSKTF